MNRVRSVAGVLAAVTCVFLSVASADDHPAATGHNRTATHSWHSLLQGDAAATWRGWTSGGFPDGWQIKDGILSKDGKVEDLITQQSFGNFELELEWKIGKGGNSGIFYRGVQQYDHIYWTAPEYQLLDDANAPDGQDRLTAAGSVYGIYPAPAGVVKPFDEWNSTRIVVKGTHIEHWLNGRKIVEYEIQGADWKAKVAGSKFSAYRYGMADKGVIGIQGDHAGTLALRRMRIRELP